jgi:hypothetical protein
MAKRPPGKGKGKGADIFLGEQDTPPARKRRTPKGQGADVFLGAEGGPQPAKPSQPKRPPLLAPAAMEAALEVACPRLASSFGTIDRSHLAVILWLRVALKEAGL